MSAPVIRRPGAARRLLAATAAVVLGLAAAVAEAASFKVEGDRIVISGTLYGDRDFENFSALVRANPDIKIIRLKDFYGGVSMEAFLLYPKFIRERGLSTEFDGPCISACSMVFIGGVSRRLAPGADPEKSFIGLHGVFYMGGRPDKQWKQTYVNAMRRFTGGKFNTEVAEIAFSVPQSGFLGFFDARRMKTKPFSAALCLEEKGKLECQIVSDLDSYKLGILTP